MRYLVVFLIVICLILGLYLLYQFKKESANGRLLIWRICIDMIKDHFWLGVGQDGIRSNFLTYQSDFFQQNSGEMTTIGYHADEVAYANNDYLQLLCEQGIVGLSLFMNLLIRLKAHYLRINRTSSENRPIFLSAILSIIVILISSLFAYPLSILPLKLLFYIFIAIISSYEPTIRKENKQKIEAFYNIVVHRLANCAIGLGFCLYAILMYLAYRQEYIVREDIMSDYQERRLEEYSFLVKEDFWYITLKSGYFIRSHQFRRAIAILQTGEQYCPDKNMYYTLGNLYAANGNFTAAEQQYQFIYFALPSLITPKYFLADFYYRTDQTAKWIKYGKEVINFKPRMPTKVTLQAQNDMRNIFLINHQKF